jgi:hypothetical protein
MPAQRKYPGELRERAVKMVFEVRDRDGKGCQARGVDEDGYAGWISRVTGTPDDDDPGPRFPCVVQGRMSGCSALSGLAS